MNRVAKKARKIRLFEGISPSFANYSNFLQVKMSNVTSKQLQSCKKGWKGFAHFLHRKKASMRRAMHGSPYVELASGDVAFIFTNGDVKKIREVIESNARVAYAKAGAITPDDLWLEAGVTVVGVDRATYLQQFGVPYKVTRGKLEILKRTKLLSKGDVITDAQAVLLGAMGIRPFTYKMEILKICDDGELYDPWVLDVTEDDVESSIRATVSDAVSAAIELGMINEMTVPYMVRGVARDAMAIMAEIGEV